MAVNLSSRSYSSRYACRIHTCFWSDEPFRIFDNLKEAVFQALELGVFSIALPAILIGAVFSQRMSRRLRRAQKILNFLSRRPNRTQRLPVSRSRDESMFCPRRSIPC